MDLDYSKVRNGKVSWWLMGLVAVVIGISLTGWVTWVYGLSATININSQRISRLEESTDFIKVSLVDMGHKIDRLIERSSVKNGKFD